jgi:hypothetical protein
MKILVWQLGKEMVRLNQTSGTYATFSWAKGDLTHLLDDVVAGTISWIALASFSRRNLWW